MGALFKLTTLDHASAALLILKGRFDAHTPPLFVHTLGRGRPIGDQQPGFLISWLPTGTEPNDQPMLLPEQDLSIPVLAWLGHKLLALLPVAIGVPKPPLAPVLLFDAQHIMPAHALTQLNQGQAAQPPIGQQGALSTAEMGSHQLKKVPNDLPLSPLPGLLLRHHAPGDWQDA